MRPYLARTKMLKKQHARVYTRCGACGLFSHEEHLFHSCEMQLSCSSLTVRTIELILMHVVVRRGSEFTDHGPSQFFADQYSMSCDDVTFCAMIDCLKPHSETSIVHTDCLESRRAATFVDLPAAGYRTGSSVYECV